nr:hypothetical protein CTI12_AA488940 [Tanacetum cinerariifolium]
MSTTSISSPVAYSRVLSNTHFIKPSNSSSNFIKLNNHNHGMLLHNKMVVRKHDGFRCNSTSDPSSGENESKEVLDAFFLGKAFAEALNERIESTVGEFLSTVGRLQAEQQKQVQEFQDEVLERAKKAKEKAAREAMEAQGIVPQSAAPNISSANAIKTENASVTVSVAIDEPTASPSSPSEVSEDQISDNGSTDPLLGVSIDD